MAGKRPPSAADTELAEWVTAQGHPTSPRMIRTWRQHGWVARSLTRPQGYAKPTLSWNPPEAFDQALAVAKIRNGKRMSPDRISWDSSLEVTRSRSNSSGRHLGCISGPSRPCLAS